MTATAAALKRAESQLKAGYREGPNNDTKFGRYYGLNNEPWCAMFVSWCYATSKHSLPVMQAGMKNGFAAVGAGIGWAKAHGLFIPSWEAEPGDAICYGWSGPSSSWAEMHTGLIVSSGVRGSTGHTIEGNRGDRVGRFTFVVGQDVVLGVIAFHKLFDGRDKVVVTPAKPDPQPRHPKHPTNTGPPVTPPPVKPPAPAVKAMPLGPFVAAAAGFVTRRLDGRTHPLDVDSRPTVTGLRAAADKALKIGEPS